MRIVIVSVLAACAVFSMGNSGGCNGPTNSEKASSGVNKLTVQMQTNADGVTTEQQNVRDRLLADNEPGSIKHLYVISAYSGQVIVYSTVRGKVTSSGKRLTSGSRAVYGDDGVACGWYSPEVIQDDGTYGNSIPYVFWWDTKGVYHQHYVAGGQILHVSSEPLAVKSVIINMELNSDTR